MQWSRDGPRSAACSTESEAAVIWAMKRASVTVSRSVCMRKSLFNGMAANAF